MDVMAMAVLHENHGGDETRDDHTVHITREARRLHPRWAQPINRVTEPITPPPLPGSPHSGETGTPGPRNRDPLSPSSVPLLSSSPVRPFPSPSSELSRLARYFSIGIALPPRPPLASVFCSPSRPREQGIHGLPPQPASLPVSACETSPRFVSPVRPFDFVQHKQAMGAESFLGLTYRHELGMDYNFIRPDLIVGSYLRGRTISSQPFY
ncbi:hypothetical protein ABZP36_020359 [Zizania latifolia]